MKKPLVVLVDDNPENLQVLGSILEKFNYDPAFFQDGPNALKFIRKEEPDLILLDIMMPEMDGYEVCQKLQKNGITKNIPIIFLTAKTTTEDLVKGLDLGAVDFISKPFIPAELIARIKTHLALKYARDEIHTLRGIIPVCAKCKNIRDNEGLWSNFENYIEEHSEAMFSHGLCPGCEKELYGKEKWYKDRE